MKTIWKFELTITDEQIINMPRGGQILTIQTQNEVPCIWALVDPINSKEIVTIHIFGTGHPIRDNFNGKYIGTFQLQGGSLIFHVFFV